MVNWPGPGVADVVAVSVMLSVVPSGRVKEYETVSPSLGGPVKSTEVDGGAPYGLTGAVFAQDRTAVEQAEERLRYAAGNFYVNDKPTGAVVGQQPFGGARASGTNDKAGSQWNLIRWTSVRTIKGTFVPPKDYRYPHMA